MPVSCQTETLTIEKLVYGGDGLTRLPSGEVVFVPWSAPGDQACVEVKPSAKKPLQGQISQLVTSSELRTEPSCSVFGQCGGCQWQHLSLTAQREWKHNIVVESLKRIGKLEDISVQPILGGDEAAAWHYRNKVQWFVGETSGAVTLGYYKAKSHQILPFEHCWIIPEALNDLYRWLVQNLPLGSGIENITARLNAQGQSFLFLQGAQFAQDKVGIMVAQLQQAFPQLAGVAILEGARYTPLLGETDLVETLGSRQFHVSAQSFFQVNPAATMQLLQVLETCLPETIPTLLDLYAGVGLFSIWLQERAQAIVAMEESKTALTDAQANLRQNDSQNIQLMAGDVRDVLRHYDTDFQVGIVDPPRAGCHADVLSWLNLHIQEQLIYISCDPTTLARDLKFLVSEGWQVEWVQPFDMFPQTYHVETLVSLKRPDALNEVHN